MGTLRLLLAVLMLTVLPTATRAGPAISIDNLVGAGTADVAYTLGWSFSTTSEITITALGAFHGAAQVAIWEESTRALLVAVPGGGGGIQVDQFEYTSIAPYVLPVGSYRIGTLIWGDPIMPIVWPEGHCCVDPAAIVSGLTSDPAVVVGGAVYIESSLVPVEIYGLSYPANGGGGGGGSGGTGYFGPNFLIAEVPEPMTLALFGSGAALLLLKRRRGRPVDRVGTVGGMRPIQH